MSRIVIKSKTKLNAIGWLGAVLFVGAPALNFFQINVVMDSALRSMRYGGQPSGFSEILPATGLLTCAALVGLVLLLIGRETVSVALSGKDAETAAQ